MSHPRTRLLLLGFLGLALCALAASALYMSQSAQSTGYFKAHDETETRSPLPPLTELPPETPLVYAGIFVEKVYELSLVSRTFSADGYIWLEWPAEVDRLMREESISALELIRMPNRIEIWDSLFEATSEQPIELSAGRFYQRYRFSSRFYDDDILLHRDPFDSLSLPIVIEIGPLSMSQKYAGVTLVPHHQANGFIGLSGSLSGYRLELATLTPFLHHYPSRFGSWYRPTLSQARLEIVYRADYWSAFLNWIFPLLIILAVVLLAPSVAGSLGDVRIAIPSTALLSLIFLHQSYHDELPALPYLTFLDKLFSVSFAICLGLFALFTWGTTIFDQAAESERPRIAARINQIDAIFQISCLAIFIIVALVAWNGS
jgi:hypothetical protein